MSTYILAIESSCDETAAALFQGQTLLSEQIASQEVHAAYGGVVPELASRAHQAHIIPVVHQVYHDAQVALSQTTHLAFTQGPGLMGSLLVGNAFSQGLSLALDLSLLPIHHIKAHLFANFITPPYPTFPFLGLVISGGHTQLLWVESPITLTLLGETLDDAIGEAFDKIAKLLGFAYPGGAQIDKHAQEGDPYAFPFPITRMPKLDFSFSGIKTAVLYFLREEVKKRPDFIKKHLADLCASVQHALVRMISDQVKKAMEQTATKQLVIGGGVAANSELQHTLHTIAQERGCRFFSPSPYHCQDNAAMVGITAYLELQHGLQPAHLGEVAPKPRMPL